jgi:hypothetical protein
MPVHRGGTHYAMYFSHNEGLTSGDGATIKPWSVVYADAARTGDANVLDFADWETPDAARAPTVLAPDGTELSEDLTSRLDDYSVFSPTGDGATWAMYTNLSCSPETCDCTTDCPAPFIGMAVLLNP